MWPKTDLTDLLGNEHPIIQAPMAGSTTVELVAAVCNAGGIGSMEKDLSRFIRRLD
jgi:nitronate monooxygenase